MVLPIDAAVIAAATTTDHAGWHNEIDTLLPALGLPTVTTASTGHLGHHELIHAATTLGLPYDVNASDVGHLEHHRYAHLYLTRGPQTGVTQPGGSTAVAPGASISAAITSEGAGGTVFLQAGLHRLASPVTPLANQTILGEHGAIVDGSVVIGGAWTVSGSQSWAAAQLPGTASTAGVCEGGGSLCQPAEDVFRNGVKLDRVANQAAVVAGTFWADYSLNRIYLATADNPSGNTIEQAKCAAFIGSSQATAANVTIRNLHVRKFANPYQTGMVMANQGGATSGSHWTIDQCHFEYGHADAVGSFSHWTVIRRNIVTRAGSVGIKAFNNDFMVIEGNETIECNTNNFDPGWEAGGSKIVKIDDCTVAGNVFRDTNATGLWIDIDARRVLIEYNGVHDSHHHGIYYEISYDGTIRRNRVTNAIDSGIHWNASTRGEVTGNTVLNSGKGLWFIEDPGRQTSDPPSYPGDPRTLLGVTVDNNHVSQLHSAGHAAGIQIFNSGNVSHLDEVTFTNNTYRLTGTAAQRYFYFPSNNTWAQWNTNGKDTTSTAVFLKAFTSAEGGTDETTVTTANSGGNSGTAFNAVNIVAGGTQVFDNARAAKGNLSYRLATGATSGTSRFDWTTAVGTITGTFYLRWFMYWTANPAVSVRLAQLLTGGGVNLGTGILLNTSGMVQMLNAASSGTIQTSAIGLNQWVRVEAKVTLSTTVGQHELRLYNNPYSATPTQTVASAADLVLTADLDTYRFGTAVAATNVGPFWLDELAIATDDWIGV